MESQRLAEWTRKRDPAICCLQDTRVRSQHTPRWKVKGRKGTFYANVTKGGEWRGGCPNLRHGRLYIELLTETEEDAVCE